MSTPLIQCLLTQKNTGHNVSIIHFLVRQKEVSDPNIGDTTQEGVILCSVNENNYYNNY